LQGGAEPLDDDIFPDLEEFRQVHDFKTSQFTSFLVFWLTHDLKHLIPSEDVLAVFQWMNEGGNGFTGLMKHKRYCYTSFVISCGVERILSRKNAQNCAQLIVEVSELYDWEFEDLWDVCDQLR
jgi:predicted phosphoadenosine phosphosulfate sulfurtransferase